MKNKLLKGFTYLTVGAIIAKFIGAIYKVLLARILGAQNLGIYHQIFPVYTFFVVLITSGVPLGVSKLFVKKETDKEKIKTLKLLLTIFFVISLILSVCLFLGANTISAWQSKEQIFGCYYVLAPAIIFSAISAVLKGYFQSYNNFKPTAISQIIEQIAKVVFGLGLSLAFSGSGYVAQILGAVLGVCLGDFASLIILFYYFKKENIKFEKLKFETKEINQFVKIIFPITLASLIVPLSQFIDSILIVKLLNRNFNLPMSSYLYGLQSGVVNTIISFPSVITFALTSVLLPSLTKDFNEKNEENFSRKFSFAIKLILILVVPCALFVLFFPKQIISLLYSGSLNSFNVNGVDLTSKLLFWSAFNIVFLCFSQFLSICLQAREHRYFPAINNAIGMLVKLVLEILFVPTTPLNILAFTLASSIGYFVIFSLNFYELKTELKIKIEHRFWIKLSLINIIVVLIAIVLNMLDVNNLGFVIISVASVVLYCFLLFCFKIFSKQEILKYLKVNK